MTALTKARDTKRYAPGKYEPLELKQYGVAAATTIYAGSMIALNASGYIVPASKDITLKVVGFAEVGVDNSAGANGAKKIIPARGVFLMENGSGGDALADTDLYADCYAEDDNVVTKLRATSTGSTQQVITGTPTAANSTQYSVRLRWSYGDGVWTERVLEHLSDGTATATEICDNLRTDLAAKPELTGVITGTGTTTLVLTGGHGVIFEAADVGPGVIAYAATTAGVYTSVRRPKAGKFLGLDSKNSKPMVLLGYDA